MDFDQPPVLRVTFESPGPDGVEEWAARIPAVRQLIEQGLTLDPGVTFLVGENGSGKSTLLEAIAAAYGLNPEGGTAFGGQRTQQTESGLGRCLSIQRGLGAGRWGFFLRAETMHGWYTFQRENPGRFDPDFHAMSHGESFLAVADRRMDSSGFYCLDEPEAALSFSSTLAFIRILRDLARDGAQVLCATHSPVLCSLPGATIMEVGEWGWRRAEWEDLDLVRHWRAYLDAPHRYLRHTLADD